MFIHIFALYVGVWVTAIPVDTKLLRKHFPENDFSEFSKEFAPSISPGKKDLFMELRMEFMKFGKNYFRIFFLSSNFVSEGISE